MRDADLAAIVTETIDAAIDPTRWDHVCDRIATHCSATAFVLFQYDLARHSAPSFHGSRFIREDGAPFVDAMVRGEVDEDRRAYELASQIPPFALTREIDVYDVATEAELPPNQFRQRLFEAGGARSRSILRMNDIGPWLDLAAIHLPHPGEAIPEELGPRLEFLMPILAKSIETGRVVQGLARHYSALMSLFDRLDFGAAFCEADGRIVLTNPAFRHLAGDRDGLTAAGGIAGATSPNDHEQLRTAISAAQRPDAAPGSLIVTLRRQSGALPLIARAAPVNGIDPGTQRPGLTLLVVIDPEETERLSSEGLAAFGLLSRDELTLCDHLVRGLGTAEIAERTDQSQPATRGAIDAVADKLHCRSRLDLLRLAMVTAIPVQDGGPASSRPAEAVRSYSK